MDDFIVPDGVEDDEDYNDKPRKKKSKARKVEKKKRSSRIIESSDEDELEDKSQKKSIVCLSDSEAEDDNFSVGKRNKGKAKAKFTKNAQDSDVEMLDAQGTSAALGVQPKMMSKFLPSTKMIWM